MSSNAKLPRVPPGRCPRATSPPISTRRQICPRPPDSVNRSHPVKVGPAGGHGLELVERLADELGQVALTGVVDPAFECNLEDGDPRLGSQTRGGVRDAALAQGGGYRRGE